MENGKNSEANEARLRAPPKEEPLLGGEGLLKLTTAAPYHALDLLQTPFGFVFWLIEQRKAKLQNYVDKERSAQ
jgi:hypothetical protein